MHRLTPPLAAATWAYARSTASATSAPRPCRSWAASRPNLNPRHPPHRDASRHAPPRLRALPGANARALDKARGLDADVLILDLEDAVAPTPSQARAQVAAALRAGGYDRRECVARINALDTPWGLDDARALAAAGADAVLLPRSKARPSWTRWRGQWTRPARPRPSLVGHVRNAVGLSASGRHRRPSPAGGPGRGHVGPGQDLHARHTPGREETLLARSLAIMAARAHGLAALDGVHLDLDDERAWRWPASKAATRASTARR